MSSSSKVDLNQFYSLDNEDELQVQANVSSLDYIYLDMVCPPLQACRDNMRILSSIKPQHSQTLLPCPPSPKQSASLSANHIIELAAEKFIHSNSGIRGNLSSSIIIDDAKDIQLVQSLLSCAEKVCNKQYDCAGKLLQECSNMSLNRMNVIQRVVYYFAEALCHKIETETGTRLTPKDQLHNLPNDSSMAKISAIYQKLPLTQVIQFPGIQSVVDHISNCKKVHIIDLNICCGVQQMILLQSLAATSDLSLQHVKMTAVAINSDPLTEEAGLRLRSLAKSLKLGFSFHVISLECFLDHQENPFDPDPEETVVVNAAFALRQMIAEHNQLETLMRVIKKLNPSLMIITEAEANVNSPVFVNRFVESLFFFGAFFDYVDECLDNDDERASLESALLSPAIRNVVAAEGEERKYRIVGVNVWRAFFARFGMVETELSKLAVSHANLVLEKFDCRDSCSLSMNGDCLLVSWKETPMCSLSAWKFQEM